uniref:UPAR/Ly6 domain-containing protein n=1 Tax=Clastoptera arizonana TaxID=38151 RepID=A0A1B6ED59_9HEMI
MRIHWSISFALVLSFGCTQMSGEFLKEQKLHRTSAANHQQNDLWCYQCDTMDDGDKCSNLSYGNHSKLVRKCPEHRTVCMVKTYSYTTSTENSTSLLRMWSLERNCTSRCEPGCIVIGERTKLYACTACCTKSLCNTGRGHGVSLLPRLFIFIWTFFILQVI